DIMINILGLDEAATGFRTFYRCAVDPTFDCPIEPPATDALVIPTPITASLNPETVNRSRGSGGIHAKRMEIGRALVDVRAESWQSVLPYFDEDFEYHDPIIDIYGAETMAQFFGRFFGSNPTLVTTIEDETMDKDVYAATWTMDGQFNGVPYSAKGMSIVKFRAGTRVIYQRDYYTEGDIMLSIPGLDEAASGFRTYYRCAVDPTFDCPIEPPTVLTGPEAVETGGYKSEPVAMFTLQQNVPNPFNPVTKISFEVPNGGAKVSLCIYDVSGRLIRTLIDGYESSGTKTVSWDGKNTQGQPVASGTYFYQLTAPSFSETKKMVLLK
ncbi:MAG: FlgD immunoglobulin-like domain containing protein, partial [bacterium]